jgi:hypothetical protein
MPWKLNDKIVPDLKNVSASRTNKDGEEVPDTRRVKFVKSGWVPVVFETNPDVLEALPLHPEWVKGWERLEHPSCKSFKEWVKFNSIEFALRMPGEKHPYIYMVTNNLIPAAFFDVWMHLWNSADWNIDAFRVLDPTYLRELTIAEAKEFEYGFREPDRNETSRLAAGKDSDDCIWGLFSFSPADWFAYTKFMTVGSLPEDDRNILQGVTWKMWQDDYPTYLNKISFDQDLCSHLLKLDGPAYDNLVRYCNHWMCMVTGQGAQALFYQKSFSCEKYQDHLALKYHRMNKGDMKTKFCNLKLANTPRAKCVFDIWLENPARRDFLHAQFVPCPIGADPYQVCHDFYKMKGRCAARDKSQILNTFPGWCWDLREVEFDPENAGFQAVMYHFRNILCSDDEQTFLDLRNWFAWIIQHPHRKTGVCWFLVGDQGVGKSLFLTMLSRLFGHHYVHITRADRLVNRFNGDSAEASLCLVDEADFSKMAKADLNYMKGMITEETDHKENKGIDVVRICSFINLIVCTNDRNPMKLEVGVNRRYQIVEVDKKHQTDTSYFENLVSAAYDDDCLGMRMFWKYLATLGELRPPHTFKKSLFTVACQIKSLEAVHRWWLQSLIYGSLAMHEKDWKDTVDVNLLYDYGTQGMKQRPNLFDFLGILARLVDIKAVTSRDYFIPDLPDARAQFLEKMCISLTWEELVEIIQDIKMVMDRKKITAPAFTGDPLEQKIREIKVPPKKRKAKENPQDKNQKKLAFHK